MIKDNPLYKDHKDMFKKRFGLAYYLRKFVSYPSNESFMFVTLAFVMFSMLSGIFFKTQHFWLAFFDYFYLHDHSFLLYFSMLLFKILL